MAPTCRRFLSACRRPSGWAWRRHAKTRHGSAPLAMSRLSTPEFRRAPLCASQRRTCFLGLTRTSHIEKMGCAHGEPKGHSRSDCSTQRMGCVSQCLVQDHQRCRLEKLCRGSQQLEELRRGWALCGLRYKPQQVPADCDDQLHVENGLHPACLELR